jgi:hypothetical protein
MSTHSLNVPSHQMTLHSQITAALYSAINVTSKQILHLQCMYTQRQTHIPGRKHGGAFSRKVRDLCPPLPSPLSSFPLSSFPLCFLSPFGQSFAPKNYIYEQSAISLPPLNNEKYLLLGLLVPPVSFESCQVLSIFFSYLLFD